MYATTSLRIHKALTQNSQLENELKKELSKLDIQKQTSGKHSKESREAFLRQRRNVWPNLFKSSGQSPVNAGQEQYGNGPRADLKRCRSTGQLFERGNGSLDSEYGVETTNETSFKNENSNSKVCSRNKEKVKGNLQRYKRISLDVPNASSWRGAFQRSKSPEEEIWITQQHTDYRDSHSLELPPITGSLSKSESNLADKTYGNFAMPSTSPTFSRKSRISEREKSKSSLALPSVDLPRIRSKSFDESSRFRRDISPVHGTSVRSSSSSSQIHANHDPAPSSRSRPIESIPMGQKRKPVSNKRTRLLRRRSLTPELTDIESSVDYLLTSADQTKLRRFRAAILALRMMGDLGKCKYLRTNNADQSQTELPPIAIDDNPQTELPSITIEDNSLNVSSASLADMFEEIRKTRYLRLRSSSFDSDEGDANESHNAPPLLIIGHTKVVFEDFDEKLAGDEGDVFK